MLVEGRHSSFNWLGRGGLRLAEDTSSYYIDCCQQILELRGALEKRSIDDAR